MTTVHKNLTGADLHEPKGADTALTGQVYVSDGAGSGVWTTASSIITNSAFTTGDVKYTFKNTADTGWIIPVDTGTIGDGSSSATIRANADTADLFALYWNLVSNTFAAVSGGRGVSAISDFAAHKRLTIPAMVGRVPQVYGVATGITNRGLGETFGVETITLSAANIPSLTSTNSSQAISVTSTSSRVVTNTGTMVSQTTFGGGALGLFADVNAVSMVSITSTGTASISATYTNASPTATSNHQPTVAINVMIKL